MQRRHLRAPVKIVITALVYAVVTVGLVAFGVERSSRVHETTRVLAERTTEAREKLRTLQVEYARAGQAFNEALLRRDLEERGTAMFTAYEHFAAMEKAWSQFLALSLDLPGEETLIRAYEETNGGSTAEGERLATLALQTEDLSDPAFQVALDAYFASIEELTATSELLVLYEREVDRQVAEIARTADDTEHQLVYFAFGGLLLASALATAFVRSSRIRDRQVAALEAEQRDVAAHNAFEATVQRALEMATEERAVYELVQHALPVAAPHHRGDVLVTDTNSSLLRSLVDPASPVCEVGSPDQCVAARRGVPLVFSTSEALDACPYLRGRPNGPCSAACSPISVAGHAVAVVHVEGPDGTPPDEQVADRTRLLAQKVGERLGMLRAFARSETEAATDPLTGLLNRRSFRARVVPMTEDDACYSVLFADLDHFKELNDTHGHDAGDRALRLFARTLRSQLRPEDLVCRYGGEEFVIVVPECDMPHARAVAERIRAAVERAHETSRVPLPPMTVSIGVAMSVQAKNFDEVVDLADHALLSAKAAGRNQVVAASDPVSTAHDDLSRAPDTTEPPAAVQPTEH